MVVSLAAADGPPQVPPWSQRDARKWLAGEPSTLSGALGKRCKRTTRGKPENGKCFPEAICYIAPCRGDAWPERRGAIGLRGREEIEARRAGQKAKMHSMYCSHLNIGTPPELNPTFRLLKIYCFPSICVENRQKMCKENRKRQKNI